MPFFYLERADFAGKGIGNQHDFVMEIDGLSKEEIQNRIVRLQKKGRGIVVEAEKDKLPTRPCPTCLKYGAV